MPVVAGWGEHYKVLDVPEKQVYFQVVASTDNARKYPDRENPRFLLGRVGQNTGMKDQYSGEKSGEFPHRKAHCL
jgi:hypothetical protein